MSAFYSSLAMCVKLIMNGSINDDGKGKSKGCVWVGMRRKKGPVFVYKHNNNDI